jgi:hypothetical protein
MIVSIFLVSMTFFIFIFISLVRCFFWIRFLYLDAPFGFIEIQLLKKKIVRKYSKLDHIFILGMRSNQIKYF